MKKDYALFGERADTLVEVLAHDNCLPSHVIVQIDLLQELVGHHFQRIVWPRLHNRSHDNVSIHIIQI